MELRLLAQHKEKIDGLIKAVSELESLQIRNVLAELGGKINLMQERQDFHHTKVEKPEDQLQPNVTLDLNNKSLVKEEVINKNFVTSVDQFNK